MLPCPAKGGACPAAGGRTWDPGACGAMRYRNFLPTSFLSIYTLPPKKKSHEYSFMTLCRGTRIACPAAGGAFPAAGGRTWDPGACGAMRYRNFLPTSFLSIYTLPPKKRAMNTLS
jgi:hypothetical protein